MFKKVEDGWKNAHLERNTFKTMVNEPEVAQIIPQPQQKLNAWFIDKQKQIPKQIPPQPLPPSPIKPQPPGQNKPVPRVPNEDTFHILNLVPINVTLKRSIYLTWF